MVVTFLCLLWGWSIQFSNHKYKTGFAEEFVNFIIIILNIIDKNVYN